MSNQFQPSDVVKTLADKREELMRRYEWDVTLTIASIEQQLLDCSKELFAQLHPSFA